MFGVTKDPKTDIVLFDRDDTFEFRKCKTAAGIATYGFGGMEISKEAVLKNAYGGSIWELGKDLNRRASKPIFICRTIDTSGIRFRKSGEKTSKKADVESREINEAIVFPMNRTEFDDRENLAAEIGRISGANKINGPDYVIAALIGLVLVMAIPVLFLGILLAMREL